MSEQIPVENRAGLESAAFDDLRQRLTTLTSMRRVLLWLKEYDPPLTMDDLVTHDEFSHDVVIPVEPGQYIVFESS